MDYKILSGHKSDLEEKVKEYIKNGWLPLGGAQPTREAGFLVQTMIKHPLPEKPIGGRIGEAISKN